MEIQEEFLATLDTGDSKAATLDDGTRLGKVTKAHGRVTAAVYSEPEFLAWVKQNYPDEVMTVVRPAFEHKILEATKKYNEAIDPNTGEEVPGVGLIAGNPYITYRAERGAVETIAERWHEIAGPSLLDGRR
ncbi:hypothetical protein [Amycolatopsis kentuckyensis]|uniref:hypothetical protein n=1 Tax=Amycolatopsis kentuckyensis TaxID=218823 RepID=UPI003567FFE0